MKIAFQGTFGSYSHLAAKNLYPTAEFSPFILFDMALDAVDSGAANAAVIPIENSSMGRVTDIHSLLPHTNLYIAQEYFLPIHHCLLVAKGTRLETVKEVHSQIPALMQCEKTVQNMGLNPIPAADTATMAKKLAEQGSQTKAALASKLAGEIYGLDVLKENMQDHAHNTTRFVVFKKQPSSPSLNEPCITTLLFTVKNIPAALNQALNAFAQQNINLLKLESYMDEKFNSTSFYVDAEAHNKSPEFTAAMGNLREITEEIRHLGTYKQADFRKK